jgi:hypothetical protein
MYIECCRFARIKGQEVPVTPAFLAASSAYAVDAEGIAVKRPGRTLNQRVAGSSPAAPTIQSLEFPPLSDTGQKEAHSRRFRAAFRTRD